MRALKAQNGRIPRGYPDHRRLEGRQYTAYCRAVLARFGPLPDVALPTLREAGRLVVELDAIGRELALARTRRRRRDAARLRRQMTPMRTQLLKLEERLEHLAARGGHDLARRLSGLES